MGRTGRTWSETFLPHEDGGSEVVAIEDGVSRLTVTEGRSDTTLKRRALIVTLEVQNLRIPVPCIDDVRDGLEKNFKAAEALENSIATPYPILDIVGQ